MNGRNIKLLIAYDGTDFSGWQRQDRARTVQETIETALEKLHGRPVALTAAGRTDTGVHAAGQVANFYTHSGGMAAGRFTRALNGLLPQDIRILDAAEVPADFHARFDAVRRVYRYHLVCGRFALPHESRFALQLWRRPNLELLGRYARLFRGEMDCSVFAASSDPSLSRFRYVYHAVFFPQAPDTLVFEIAANAFLRRMVRSVVGTLLDYEEKERTPEELAAVIRSGDRARAGVTVPSRGLFLWKVDYDFS